MSELEGGMGYFGSWFQRLLFRGSWSLFFGFVFIFDPTVRQNTWWRTVAHLMVTGTRRKPGEREKNKTQVINKKK